MEHQSTEEQLQAMRSVSSGLAARLGFHMLADAVFVTDTDRHLEEISGCFDELKTENISELGVTNSYLSDFKSPAECWNRKGFSTSRDGGGGEGGN